MQLASTNLNYRYVSYVRSIAAVKVIGSVDIVYSVVTIRRTGMTAISVARIHWKWGQHTFNTRWIIRWTNTTIDPWWRAAQHANTSTSARASNSITSACTITLRQTYPVNSTHALILLFAFRHIFVRRAVLQFLTPARPTKHKAESSVR